MKPDRPSAPSNSRRHRPIRPGCLLTLALIVATTPNAWGQSIADTVDCITATPVLDLGALPMVFVPNQGQLPEGVAFATAGLSGATATFGAGGINVTLAGEASATVQQTFIGEPTAFSAGTVGSTTVSYFHGDASHVELPAHDTLEAQLGEGLELTVQATGRRLIQTYSLTGGASNETLGWRFADTQRITTSPNGHLTILLDGSEIDLRAPRASQGTGSERVDVGAAFTTLGDEIRIELGDHDPDRAVTLTTELLHSPHSDAYGATNAGEQVLAVMATQSGSGSDTVVAALDAETDDLAWITVVGGQGDDAGNAVAVDPSGRVIVVGTTTSSDFPTIDREPNGDDGFVLTLEPGGTRILAAQLVGQDGDDDAQAVVVAENGDMLVAGRAGEGAEDQGEPEELLALFPTRDPGSRRYFVSRLTADLHETSVTVIEAGSVSRLALWHDCFGGIVIGPPVVASAGTCSGWPDLEYTMDHYADDYDQDHDYNSTDPGLGSPPGGWGYHALRWRQFHGDSVDPPPPYSIDWNLAPVSTPIPKSNPPQCGDEADLDTLETVLYQRGGSVQNPPGGWGCSTHNSVQQMALFAAFYSQRYGSAAYTTFREFSFLNNAWSTFPVAIEKTTWEVNCSSANNTYTGQGLEDLCDFTSGWYGGINCTAGLSGVTGGTLSDPFFLRAIEFEVSVWKGFVWFLRGILYETDFDFSWQDFYQASDYVVDPPDDPDEADAITEATHQLRSVMTDRVPMQLDRYSGGTRTELETGKTLVRSIALDP